MQQKNQLTVDNHSLSPDILIQEGRDLARVDPGQLQGRPLEEQGSVALVAVGVDAVVDVDVVSEPLADDLRLRHLARDPLEEGRGLAVEVPLDVELVLFALVVVEVAVQQDVFRAKLDQLGNDHFPDFDAACAWKKIGTCSEIMYAS